MQISAALPSPNFYSGKTCPYVLIEKCPYVPYTIEKFELEVVGVGILGTGFCFQGSH